MLTWEMWFDTLFLFSFILLLFSILGQDRKTGQKPRNVSILFIKSSSLIVREKKDKLTLLAEGSKRAQSSLLGILLLRLNQEFRNLLSIHLQSVFLHM